jgi:adenosylcobinamide kinase / adenosylcobinamide-phosphate guanylyltransferase
VFDLLKSEKRMHADLTRDVTLVLGGVRSGKSRYALEVAARAQRVTFLATAERRDDEEMQRKIERHRAERPQHWMTIEEPLNLASAIGSVSNCDLLLIDCLTLFAGKLLEVHGENLPAIAAGVDALCAALTIPPCSVVLVSNEVGSGVVPAFELGRRYRDLLGEINQRVAAIADYVVLMVAGLPLTLKSSLSSEVRA